MKKLFFSTALLALVLSLASCGANRKLGCPATAKTTHQPKNVNS